MQAWKNLRSLKDPAKLRGWMFSILRNQYTKLLRKESKVANPTEHIEMVAEPSPQENKNDSQEIVQAALATLDDKHRMPLLLVSMEGMSVEQASEVLDVPRGTILSRLSRGREKLKLAILAAGYIA